MRKYTYIYPYCILLYRSYLNVYFHTYTTYIPVVYYIHACRPHPAEADGVGDLKRHAQEQQPAGQRGSHVIEVCICIDCLYTIYVFV